MKKLLLPTTLALLCTQAGAAPAIYHDGVLMLEEGIVIKPNGAAYYRDLRFGIDGTGAFRVTEGAQSQLAVVEELDVVAEATEPPVVRVTLSGYKSLPCVELEPLGITRIDTTFHMVVAETPIPPNVKCMAVAAPFSVEIELDVAGLTEGDYVIAANGVKTEFALVLP